MSQLASSSLSIYHASYTYASIEKLMALKYYIVDADYYYII